MKFKILFVFLFLLPVTLIHSQDSISTDEMYVKKEFLIILSTKNYKAALSKAKEAAASINLELKLRDLTENKESGLTISKEECEKEDIEYPAYYARGRWDDGAYLSIEFSDAYSGFAKGYYIVIAASGSKEENEIQSAYKKVKMKYKDAYFKSSKVYLGCMH